MNYCMSDIHGCGEMFHAMLEKIRFSQEDRLYILGDVIDRGRDGIALLREIMEMKNAVLLLGNHEFMMLQYYHSEDSDGRWGRNGNTATREAFRQLSREEQENLLSYLESLPVQVELQLDDRKFFLVHGFPGRSVYRTVWGRPETLKTENPVPGHTLLIGHTPVPLLLCGTEQAQYEYFRELERTGGHTKILHASGFVDLDCGCSYPVPGAALGCLRLEDREEFYVVRQEAEWRKE